jgi:hypothetical protein
MGFSFKVAPGIRVRASSRGVRTSLGPRAARVHVGTGRTGFSTGVGPVSLYGSTGGGRRRQRSTGPSKTAVAARERQLRQTQKAQQAAELKAAFDAIENLHRQEVTPAAVPVAPAPVPVDEAAIRRWHEQQALRGLGILQRQARAVARKRAAEGAQRDISAAVSRGIWERSQLQQQLDGQWRQLLANDPEMVTATLTEAFEEGQTAVAVTGIENGEASLLVMVAGIEAVPERMPSQTPAGNLSIAKITKTQRNAFYLSLVCGHALIAVREALAIAPGLQAVRVAVVRQVPPDALGVHKTECLLAAVFARHHLNGVHWQSAGALQVVRDCSADLRIRLSATREPLPLNLAGEPALAGLLQVIDVGEDAPPPPVAAPAMRAPAPAPAPPTAALASPRPPQSVQGSRRAKRKPHKAVVIAACALVLLVLIIAAAHGKKPASPSNASAVAASTPTHEASATPAPKASKHKEPTKTLLKKTHSAVRTTTAPHAVRTTAAPATTHAAAPAATTPAAAPPAPAAPTTPTGCYPLSDEGTCYEPGEYCRDSDHGATGVAGDGETITCEDNDGWRWEPS